MKKVLTSRKTLLISATALIIIGGASFVAYRHFHSNKPVAEPAGQINYGPPTQREKDDTQAHKEALAQQYQQQQNSTPSTGKQQVTPFITNASQIGQQVTVNSYVSGIFEDGGICTITFTKGGAQVIKKSTAFANATTTDCPPTMVDSSEFSSKGDWQVSVSYDSDKAIGTSQSKTVTVN